MIRLALLALAPLVSGCAFLTGADAEGNPVPGILDVLAATLRTVGAADPSGGVLAGIAATGLGLGAVKLRSWAIKRAGRKDDNGNGVPDDAEGEKK